MSTVRGNAPLELTHSPKVGVDTSAQEVRIESGGWDGRRGFLVYGKLGVGCTKRLIRDLRRALRQIRDEECAKLQKAVEEAEGPL